MDHYRSLIGLVKTFANSKDRKEALKVQIKFRRKVLGQNHHDKDVFIFSHNRKPLAENELKLNLFKLLLQRNIADEPQEQSSLTFEKITADPDLLLYRRIRHRFECDGSLEWFEGTVLSYCTDTGEFTVQYQQ